MNIDVPNDSSISLVSIVSLIDVYDEKGHKVADVRRLLKGEGGIDILSLCEFAVGYHKQHPNDKTHPSLEYFSRTTVAFTLGEDAGKRKIKMTIDRIREVLKIIRFDGIFERRLSD